MGSVTTSGIVKNYNTIEDFKAADKPKLFNECADKVRTQYPTIPCSLSMR